MEHLPDKESTTSCDTSRSDMFYPVSCLTERKTPIRDKHILCGHYSLGSRSGKNETVTTHRPRIEVQYGKESSGESFSSDICGKDIVKRIHRESFFAKYYFGEFFRETLFLLLLFVGLLCWLLYASKLQPGTCSGRK